MSERKDEATWLVIQRTPKGDIGAIYYGIIPATHQHDIVDKVRLDTRPEWNEWCDRPLDELTRLYRAGKMGPPVLPDLPREEGAQPQLSGVDSPDREPLLQFFRFEHLAEELQEVSEPFANLAKHIAIVLPKNNQRDRCLAKLLEAKDCAVRARLYQ